MSTYANALGIGMYLLIVFAVSCYDVPLQDCETVFAVGSPETEDTAYQRDDGLYYARVYASAPALHPYVDCVVMSGAALSCGWR